MLEPCGVWQHAPNGTLVSVLVDSNRVSNGAVPTTGCRVSALRSCFVILLTSRHQCANKMMRRQFKGYDQHRYHGSARVVLNFSKPFIHRILFDTWDTRYGVAVQERLYSLLIRVKEQNSTGYLVCIDSLQLPTVSYRYIACMQSLLQYPPYTSTWALWLRFDI